MLRNNMVLWSIWNCLCYNGFYVSQTVLNYIKPIVERGLRTHYCIPIYSQDANICLSTFTQNIESYLAKNKPVCEICMKNVDTAALLNLMHSRAFRETCILQTASCSESL